jgi:hypothetical protein
MLNVRKLSVKDRVSLYLKHRIGKQKKWYNDNCSKNENLGNIFFYIIFGSQIVALLSSYLYVIDKNAVFNPAAVFATFAASFITWAQVKQFKTLSQSYGYTAYELGSIYDLGKNVTTEEDLTKFVVDSEQAISREHTMWLARKIEQ